jgi:hypothetical protein
MIHFSDLEDFSEEEIENLFNPDLISNEDVQLLTNFSPNIKILLHSENSIHFKLPTSVLPKALVETFGFNCSKYLLDISLVLGYSGWDGKPTSLLITHEVYKLKFTGYPFINTLKYKFFNAHYQPPDKIFGISTTSRLFLFVLETILRFHKLQNHCCVCGRKLEFEGIKPVCCNNSSCELSFFDFGVGSSVIYLIKKDPIVVDFFLSCYFTTEITQYLDPAPPQHLREQTNTLKSTLPSITDLTKLNTDLEIKQIVGDEQFNLLKWILFKNRSHFITLPNQLRFSQFPNCVQFMTLISTSESELEFQKRKKQYGSSFYWHGSNGVRWYPIQRKGLKNCSNTPLMSAGAALSPGIYMARNSSTSFGYSSPVPNQFSKCSSNRTL